MLNKKFIIVANGEFKNESINHSDFDLICACDGGYKYLEKLNIVPDIAIGDFDSLGYVPKCKEVINEYENKWDGVYDMIGREWNNNYRYKTCSYEFMSVVWKVFNK